MGVEGDPKDFYRLFEGKEFIVEEDLRVDFGFAIVGSKKGNRRFVRSYGKANGLGPSFNFGKIGI